MDPTTLRAVDAEHVWHPYGGFPPTTPPRVVREARGVHLHLDDGTELVDAMSSWWAVIHGYRHPRLDAAVVEQLSSMSHVMFGGLTHEPAAALTAALVDLTPDPLRKVFLADSGSVAVEVAVKMAMQYWRSRGRNDKRRLLTWRGGYHGDTFAAMSVCDPDGGMHSLWRGSITEQHFVPAPPDRRLGMVAVTEYLGAIDAHLARHRDELAAMIIEPIVQGAGGMSFHAPELVAGLRELCDRHEVLLICDEIATGFGRTGTLFAVDAAGISPDIMCVGKALTGGYLTLAATLTTDDIAETISRGEAGGLAHGPTFMGNPLACAVACASLAVLAESDWRTRVPDIGRRLASGLAPLIGRAGVVDVRTIGAIAVIELDHQVDMIAATDAAVAAGVWLRPFRNLIYAMPPYVIDDDQLDTVVAGMTAAALSSIAATAVAS